MAYLETLTSQIVTALQNNGLTVFTEYELQTAPVPSAPKFVTIAAEQMQTGAQLPYPNGTAMPVTLRLRFRLHGLPDSDPDELAILWELCILPELVQNGYPMTDTALGELRYVRQLDRIVREGTVQMPALLTRTSSD